MDRFFRDNLVCGSFSDLPGDFEDDLKPVCPYADRSVGSVNATVSCGDDSSTSFPLSCSKGTLKYQDTTFVQSLHKKLNPGSLSDITVNFVYLKYGSLSLKGKSYGCGKSVGRRADYLALAEWDKAVW